MMNNHNKVFCGDSLQTLEKLNDESVELCYLDPPFCANRTFEARSADGTFTSFDDTWSSLEEYIEFMKNVLTECKRVLKKNGSLYLHCDMHASHYLKIELDKIFRRKNFRNEIIWQRHNAHNDTKQGGKLFGRVHDTIFHFSKSSKFTWNPMYQPYPDEYTKKYYNKVEEETSRRYALGDLSGPGGASKGNPKYRFLGITRYWRFSKKRMEKMYSDGLIVQRRKGTVPLQKRYLDEMPGIMLQDLWTDIQSVQLSKKEIVGYPTQKPMKLLERIIQISSNPQDTVLDPFCGSGTTLVAAMNLDRDYIGIDRNPDACKITRRRLKRRQVEYIRNSQKIISNKIQI